MTLRLIAHGFIGLVVGAIGERIDGYALGPALLLALGAMTASVLATLIPIEAAPRSRR